MIDLAEIEKIYDAATAASLEAALAFGRGDTAQKEVFIRESFELARQAALALKDELDLEPSRGIVLRTAALYATHAREHAEAVRLVGLGLAGNPYPADRTELLRILDIATYQERLEVNKLRMSDDELRLSVYGADTIDGFSLSTRVLQPARTTSQLLRRLLESEGKLPFHDVRRPDSTFHRNHPILTSGVDSSAAVVRFKVVGSTQGELFDPIDPDAVVRKAVDLIRVAQEDGVKGVRRQIKEAPYARSVTGLVRRLAPRRPSSSIDRATTISIGRSSSASSPTLKRPDDVDAVVITGISSEKIVSGSAPLFDLSQQATSRQAVLRGKLVGADAESMQANEIVLVSQVGERHKVIVPKGMMNDVVRPYFNKTIRAEVSQRGSVFRLLGVQEDLEDVE